MTKFRWVISPPVPRDALARLRAIPISTAQISYNRGLTDLSLIKKFLSIEHRPLPDPNLLPDIAPAIERIAAAIQKRELIAVYGDFDADGVTATALLNNGLTGLGARTTPYIPHRTEEGHGLSVQGLEKFGGLGVGLIITADCGVSSLNEINLANEMGIDVVVTDHHTPPPDLPPALAVIDAKRQDSEYPFRELAAVGLAYRIIQTLRAHLGHDEDESLLDLVALGSVADMAPLVDDNRNLVKRGLEVLNRAERPGLRELMSRAGVDPGNLDAESISFTLAPRINAAGRVDHAITSYRLLTATSSAEAQPLAEELNTRNRQRRSHTEDAFAKAQAQVGDSPVSSPIIIAGGPGFEPGVVGLVAGKLSEEHYKPAVVLSTGPEISRASCRSIPEFDITAALQQCADLFIRHGGHSQAAGFVIANENIEELKGRLAEIAAERLGSLDLQPSIKIDVVMPLTQIEARLLKFIQLLEPVGQGNPRPMFLSKRLTPLGIRTMGADGSHLRMSLQDGASVWNAVAFKMGHRIGELTGPIDAVYHIKTNRWKGRERLELEMVDFAPAGQVTPASSRQRPY